MFGNPAKMVNPTANPNGIEAEKRHHVYSGFEKFRHVLDVIAQAMTTLYKVKANWLTTYFSEPGGTQQVAQLTARDGVAESLEERVLGSLYVTPIFRHGRDLKRRVIGFGSDKRTARDEYSIHFPQHGRRVAQMFN